MNTKLDEIMLEILDNISEGCSFLNSNMEVEFINKAGEALLEKPKEEIMNKCQWDVLPKYKETIVYELYNKAFREQTVQYFEMITEYTKIPVEVRVFPNKYGLFLLFNDVTKKKQEEKKQRYYDQLKIIGEMAAGVAHEVRNPLTTIKGFLQLMEKNEDFGDYRNLFNLMIEEVNRINEIITGFLDLSKEKPNKLENSDLNDIITTIIPLLETRALQEGKHIKLELGSIPKLNVDKNEIRQLLLNLINNSLDAMAKGQSVQIITAVEEGHVMLSIMDEGEGIPSHIIDKISVPFVTSKDTGTGLGLSICYSIAKRNNAEINYTSSSKGTTFNICFYH